MSAKRPEAIRPRECPVSGLEARAVCAPLPTSGLRSLLATIHAPPMARLKDIVIDADQPAALARFWAAALEGYEIAPYDDAEIARLAALGLTPETDTSVMVEGPGPRLCFHQMARPRGERNRLHFDLTAERPAEEIARLVALGASRSRDGDGYTVLRDPEGNPFCVGGC